MNYFLKNIFFYLFFFDQFLSNIKEIQTNDNVLFLYIKEEHEISFLLIVDDNFFIFNKKNKTSLVFKKNKLKKLKLYDQKTIKMFFLSKNLAEIVHQKNLIEFIFNFLTNIKNQYSLSLEEQKQIYWEILNLSEQKFSKNTLPKINENDYEWVD